jgi:hypothetical protein
MDRGDEIAYSGFDTLPANSELVTTEMDLKFQACSTLYSKKGVFLCNLT